MEVDPFQKALTLDTEFNSNGFQNGSLTNHRLAAGE